MWCYLLNTADKHCTCLMIQLTFVVGREGGDFSIQFIQLIHSTNWPALSFERGFNDSSLLQDSVAEELKTFAEHLKPYLLRLVSTDLLQYRNQ